MQSTILIIAKSAILADAIPLPFLRQCLAIAVLVIPVWMLGFIIFSVFSRRRDGKPIFRPRFPNALFAETWRSGRWMGKGLARFGGAENCLWITITDTELWVCPHFPFNLGGLPEKLRLEHRIRGTDIISVEHKTYMWGFRRVLIHARDPMGTEEAFEISIRDVDAFDRAMERIRNPGAKS